MLADVGNLLPLFNEYAVLFKNNQTVKYVLRLFYTEILEFYKILLNFMNDRSRFALLGQVEYALIKCLDRTENMPRAILAQCPLKDFRCGGQYQASQRSFNRSCDARTHLAVRKAPAAGIARVCAQRRIPNRTRIRRSSCRVQANNVPWDTGGDASKEFGRVRVLAGYK